ncbi:MAG: hypothetical protein WD066_11160 [Planctomycetaceae bacterium]
MWCPNCQADVAAEVSADNQRVRCASCGSELSAVAPASSSEKTRHALELLERWSSNSLLDPYGPVPKSRPKRSDETTADEAAPRERKSVPSRRPSKPHFRMDARHDPPFGKPPREKAAEIATDDDETAATPRSARAIDEARIADERRAGDEPRARFDENAARGPRVHAAHASAPAPHFDARSFAQPEPPVKTNVATQAGQYLAYLGVGTLAVGTILVLWGYFGGPDGYAPTGWLIATAGQMLLFLGVVTLVSGGMDQTNHDVKTRIERLGEQLLRFEQTTRDHALRGPYIPAERYAEGERDDATTRRGARVASAVEERGDDSA